MPIESRIIRQSVQNTDTTIDFTASGFGAVQGVIISAYVSNTPDVGQYDVNNQGSHTFWDGTRTRCVGICDRDNVGTTSTQTYQCDDALVVTGRFQGLAVFTISAIANGIRLTTVSNNIPRINVEVLLIKGVSNLYVNDYTIPTTNGTSLNVTDPGFSPDVLLTLTGASIFEPNASLSLFNDALIAYGMVAKEGATFNSRSFSYGINNGDATSDVIARADNSDKLAENVFVNLSDHSFVSFDVNGFTIIKNGNLSGNRQAGYLAIELDGDSAECFSLANPASPGNASVTGLSLQPDTIIGIATKSNTFASQVSDARSETFGTCIIDSADSIHSMGGASRDNVGTTDTCTFDTNSSYALYDPQNVGVRNEASFVSKNSDGFTLNFTTVNIANNPIYFGVAIGGGGVPPAGRKPDLMPFFNHMVSRG